VPLTPGVRPTAVVAPTFASCSATRYPAKLSEKSEKEPMEVSTVHVPSRAEPVAAPEPGDAAAGADGDADEAGEGDPDEVEAVEAGEDQEEQPDWQWLIGLIGEEMAMGSSASEACRTVATLREVSRRELYNRYLDAQRDPGI